MDGIKINPVISFLDDLNKKRAVADANAKLAEDPTIRMRRLQAAKDDGREKCLSYIFGHLCKNATPTPGEVPYTPAPLPDLDKVVRDFIASRTGGQGASFYVKEAIKKNGSACAKNLLESVDKLLSELYFEKELDPQKIEDSDLTFQMTPEITSKLGQMIKDNNLDELADAIKSNVRADAIDEVIAAKQEKEKRMALEEELKNDPTITTPAQIQEAVDLRYNPRNLVFYQPRLLEGILIKHFNEAASKDNVITESSIEFSDGSMNYCWRSSLARVTTLYEDMSDRHQPKYAERLKCMLQNEHQEVRRQYYWDVMPIDIEKLIDKLEHLIEHKKINPDRQVELIDTDKYIHEVEELHEKLREALSKNNSVIDIPIRSGKIIKISEIPGMLRKSIGHIKLEKNYMEEVNKYVTFAEEISKKYNQDESDLDATYKAVALAGLIDIEINYIFINNARSMIDRIRDMIQTVEMSQPMTEAFSLALYEYTMFNIAKAFRMESFSIPEIKSIAKSYAQG